MDAQEEYIQIKSKRDLVAAFEALHHRIAALEEGRWPSPAEEVGERVRHIVRSVPDIVYQLDPEGRIVFISDAIADYGYDPEVLVGSSIFDLVHPDDREKALYRINERRSGERSTRALELRLLTKNRRSVSFEFRSSDMPSAEYPPLLSVDAEGIYAQEEGGCQFLYTQGVARDVSAQKKKEEHQLGLRRQLEERVAAGDAELQETSTHLHEEVAQRKRAVEALRQSEERYRLLVETSPDAVYVLRGGCIVFANVAGLDFLAADGQESIFERPLFDFLQPEGDLRGKIFGGRPQRRRYRRLDGSVVEAECRTVPFVYDNEPAVLLVVRDITLEQRRERRREALRRLREAVWALQGMEDLPGALCCLGEGLVASGLDFDGCAVQLVLQGGDGVSGWRWFRQGQTCEPFTGEDPLVARFMQAGIPFYRSDLEAEDAYLEADIQKAQWGIPVRAALDLPFAQGTVALVSDGPRAFDQEDIDMAEEAVAVLAAGCRHLEDRRQQAQRQAEAEATAAALKQALAREEAMGQVRERIIAMREIADLPGADFWIGTLQRLGVQIQSISLQFPAAEEGFFVSYDFDARAYSEPTPLTRFPWIKEVWDGGEPVLVERPLLDELGFADRDVAEILEVPLPGGGSVGVNAGRSGGLGNEETRSVRLCAGLLAEGIKRWQDFNALGRREEELRQENQMEAVGRLTAGIAHNFNNILQGVMGNLHLGLRDVGAEQREVLEYAEKGVRRAADLVQQLMVFARQGIQPVYGPLAADVLVGDAVDICRQTFDRRIRIETGGEQGLGVLGDAGQLQQVLLNLCLNARDAVEAAASDDLRIRLRLGRAEDFVRIDVEDNGIGMEMDIQRHMYDPFFTTKEVDKGLGLGLSTVYGIVHQHQGRIECVSEPGRGTTFSLFLPPSPSMATAQVPEAAAPQSAEVQVGKTEEDAADDGDGGMPGGNEGILLVEDDDVVRHATRRVLESCGYRVWEATNGNAALERCASLGEEVDLVLLDLSLPEKSGLEVLEDLRRSASPPKVLIFTGYGAVIEESPPAVGVVQKPFLLDDLARRVRQVIDS